MARIPAAERRVALLHAALRVIAADGVAGATTRAIVAEAGMSLASFHYAFASRDAMMRELIGHIVEHQTLDAFTSFRRGTDLRAALSEGLHAFFSVVAAHPGREQAMVELMQYALRTPGAADLPRDQYGRYRAAVGELLGVAAADTGMSWLLPVDDVARIVVTITDGVTLAWLADRDVDAARRVIEFAATSVAALAQPLTDRPQPTETRP